LEFQGKIIQEICVLEIEVKGQGQGQLENSMQHSIIPGYTHSHNQPTEVLGPWVQAFSGYGSETLFQLKITLNLTFDPVTSI
jgi:hypothetical protein